uniref:Conotoxin Am1099 n=1 Tax=Conus amadis TaxID=198732 RepID=T1098_CONAA|nr:RecName: Full=Conotoxin Am1099 [Conus amadis]
CCQLFVWCC